MKFIIEKKKNKDNYQIIEWLNDDLLGQSFLKTFFKFHWILFPLFY